MNKKKILIICLIIIIAASLITNIYILSTKKDPEEAQKIEGIESTENKDILKDTNIDDLSITNISLLTRDGISSYSATITNNSNEDIKINKLYVTFFEGTEENKLLGLSNVTISAKKSSQINITADIDLSKTEKIEYVLE